MSHQRLAENFTARCLIRLGLAVVLAFNCYVRWHLRAMPLERDEGEYACAGQLILQGVPPYQLAWNMKFPGVYFAYAAVMSVFGQSPAGIHLGLMLVTSISTLLTFFIGRKLINSTGGLLAAALFALLSALPAAYGLAGHATHFVVLFVCAGTWMLLRKEQEGSVPWIFAAGTAFGAAILMKQHAVAFAGAAFAWVMWQSMRQGRRPVLSVAVFLCGVAIPVLLTFALLMLAGVWDRFHFWTIQYAHQYISIFPLRSVPRQFAAGFGPVFHSGIWVWVLGVAGLGMILFRTQFRRAALLSGGLFVAGFAAACPGFYFSGHYFLTAMPGLALLNALLLIALAAWVQRFPGIQMLKVLPVCLFCVVAADLLLRNATLWFEASPSRVGANLYGRNPFAESAEIAGYIHARTNPDETIAVLGSEPQIYFLAHRRPASGYIYFYPLTEPQPLALAMRKEFKSEIESARPKYVVHVNILSSWCSAVVPGETGNILEDFQNWWDQFSQHYQLVGVVDIEEGKPSEFFWDDQLSSRTNTAPPEVSVFRRK